jgi:ligand-binding sensor domain-containing protein
VLFAGTGGGLFRSVDRGIGWSPVGGGIPAVAVKALLFAGADELYAGTESGVFRSTDGGAGWVASSGGLTAPDVVSLARSSAGVLVAGTNGGGLFRSTNAGVVWAHAAGDWTQGAVEAIVNEPAGVLAAATQCGVLRSSDQGVTWVQLDSGLTDPRLLSLAVSPQGSLLVGTISSGVFVRSASSSTAGEGPSHAGGSFELHQNYPNPFNPQTNIRFVLEPSAGELYAGDPVPARLAVYDLLGREMAVLLDGPLPSGTHRVVFDGSSLPSGVYIYRLRIGGRSETRRMLLLR